MATVLRQDQVHVDINLERCAGCQECIVRCPTGALSLDSTIWKAVADDAACVGCRQCVRTCPFSAIAVKGPLLIVPRTAAHVHPDDHVFGKTEEVHQGFHAWDQALKEAGRCLSCPDPTCVLGCPAHNDIPGFIEAIRLRDLNTAHQVLARTTMMPDICSRVCDQSSQCEGACSLKLAGGQAVAIGLLERFIADQTPVPPPSRQSPDGKDLKVAVVGAGPAGMSVAWTLLQHGADVTVFEKEEQGLGVLRWGIPSFSLPDEVADRPIDALTASGAKVCYGTEIKPEDMDKLLSTYDALVLAHGAGIGISLPVPGRDLKGIVDATTFLTEAKAALREGRSLKEIRDGTRILVAGAGNTAMDVARSARRLGAGEVTAVDWVDARFAKVRADELMQARREGVTIRFQTQVLELVGSDRIEGAVFASTRQQRASELPKRTNAPLERIAVDMVIMAVGYRPDPALGASIGAKLPLRPETPPAIIGRRLMATGLSAPGREMVEWVLRRDRACEEARQPKGQRVWVVGDALTGPQTVVTAMAQGREAALAILAAKPRSGAPAMPPVLTAK